MPYPFFVPQLYKLDRKNLSGNERLNYQIIAVDLAFEVEWSWAPPSGTKIIGSITKFRSALALQGVNCARETMISAYC